MQTSLDKTIYVLERLCHLKPTECLTWLIEEQETLFWMDFWYIHTLTDLQILNWWLKVVPWCTDEWKPGRNAQKSGKGSNTINTYARHSIIQQKNLNECYVFQILFHSHFSISQKQDFDKTFLEIYINMCC